MQVLDQIAKPVSQHMTGAKAVTLARLPALPALEREEDWQSTLHRMVQFRQDGFTHVVVTAHFAADAGGISVPLLSSLIRQARAADIGVILGIDTGDLDALPSLSPILDTLDGLLIGGLQDASSAAIRHFTDLASREGRLLIGDMAGTPIHRLQDFEQTGLTHVLSSYPWWDGIGIWFWRELAALQRIAAVIHPLPEHDDDTRFIFQAELAAILGTGLSVTASWGQADDQASARNIALRQANDRAHFLARFSRSAVLISAPGAELIACLRSGTDGSGRLLLVNTSTTSSVTPPADLLAASRTALSLRNPVPITISPLGTVDIEVSPAPPIVERASLSVIDSALNASHWARIAIENVSPAVNDGDFPARRTVGETVTVEADILCEGHDVQAVSVLWRAKDETGWHESRMQPLGNDRWQGSFPLTRLGDHVFCIEAWRDEFGTYREELRKKYEAGNDITLELQEGRLLVERLIKGHEDVPDGLKALTSADDQATRAALLAPGTAEHLASLDPRPFRTRSAFYPVEAERQAARFASWYEIFPRSMSDDPERHGTFRDVEKHLPRIRDMGFDVLYFPPIHPIGRQNRKGRNNTLTPSDTDPGSPYAIGSEVGGHDALHPELGTLEDFRHLRDEAARHGLELALDFAVQCSPDHPWLKQHPGWFAWRPDGTIKYAENPPKKYQDIVNVDFYSDKAIPDLWVALYHVVMMWVTEGVRIFRVDNPHTKPFPFWQWLIAEIRKTHPDTLFLAEAFTRPKIMYRLAKIGFSQSYTYFTWRNSKAELAEYLQELIGTSTREFFRPNFFVNTPDINPTFLQTSGRPGFRIRAALAATLSGLWGVYSGFELCEGRALPGKEEYAESEKYEIKAWDWDRPGNIVDDIRVLNRLRRDNPALQSHLTVRFLTAWNDAVLFYEKATPDRQNVLLIAVTVDPFNAQETDIEIPLWLWNLPDHGSLAMEDLISGDDFTWTGKIQHIRLDPWTRPYAIWRARPAT
ncbi:alpha-1,4-glucan--maltose-1-phosphate maltosyltransferase [Granulibacter bethesdensis]|uniref:alpha-1,4-glucan--maltose-1-phosphate maltosyltransferase n=1 Tax=Granulibacter bethesdensis TaxID=364410 RepID=UPI0003F20981|nr:alpha-1,4-glucan--maltose-1-phosphate maltosyltransferase [Granulibacter bethesdensis]AHJ69532.1 Alpha-amylase family protein [Granulibacter bethesdensis]